MQDALTHTINLGQWIAGKIDRVVADLAHQVLEGVDVEDTAHVLARHGDLLATYGLNQHQSPNESTIQVVCERGTARFESHLSRWRSMRKPGGEWEDHQFPPMERDTPFINQADAFLDSLEGKASPLCTLEEGIDTLQVNLAILESARHNCWQTIERGQSQ